MGLGPGGGSGTTAPPAKCGSAGRRAERADGAGDGADEL